MAGSTYRSPQQKEDSKNNDRYHLAWNKAPHNEAGPETSWRVEVGAGGRC